MSVYTKNLHRDEEEDKIDQEKIDKLISFIFLLIIGITPLIIIASTSMFYTPIIENDDIFTSGIKGDVYSLLKIKFFYLMSLIIIGLFTYLTFNYLVIRTALQQYRSGFTNYYLFPILISIVLIMLYQILVSVPDVYIFLYIFSALISIMNIIQHRKGEIH